MDYLAKYILERNIACEVFFITSIEIYIFYSKIYYSYNIYKNVFKC